VNARVGSLAAFWPLLEPVLNALVPRSVCEIGVADGAFSRALIAWSALRGCGYVGIDPAPSAGADTFDGPDVALVRGRSLDVLPGRAPCDAYFIDGDHNYHTVRAELEAIAGAAPGAVVCLHDVAWPWARRDMYHAPEAIPETERHAYSAELGVVPESDGLVDGGLREPGSYVIACRSGGPRNGVLTAVEDFLAAAREGGAPWQCVLVPAAYGLAVLWRADLVPPTCARELARLEEAASVLRGFLGVVESNYLALYLFEEHVSRRADDLQSQVAGWEAQYAALREQYDGLQSAYADLSAHAASLLREYETLDGAYRGLQAPPDGPG
jgi:Methyltransferase domain